ncbi:biotin/lipoyl-binding protein [Microbulbifer elongatus]|uniref:Biotin/lipoyl-binding protein n=1 Tax=Microbulbifer elongatus TaxID=86173 RepID=A0ABT1NXE0_9GAMM|nr:biotin/lipoyl-binding protein [Microbulbifer elongatus]MCQ3828552.1 biotin/lipoyl-binding protein [Microbulbifer elongatus]
MSIRCVNLRCAVVSLLLLLAACGEQEEVALGTLEWDRIALPAPAAEKVVRIYVREGERVEPGQRLLDLDDAEALAQLRNAEAAVAQAQAALIELRVGPRVEEIERARASLASARATLTDREADYQRLVALGRKNYASRSDIDGARAAAESARAQVRAAREQLLELERGTRVEDVDQGEASLAAARAQAQAQRVLLEKLRLRAPRAGVVDSIPFKLGDQAPVGSALVVLLAGITPYARVYVPQSLRRQVIVGGRARIILDSSVVSGEPQQAEADRRALFDGRVRMVRNEPSFTPYYALTGDDVTRLSYIAEVQLRNEPRAAALPAGLPLRVEFLPETVGGEAYPQGDILAEPHISGAPSPPDAPRENLPGPDGALPHKGTAPARSRYPELRDGGK